MSIEKVTVKVGDKEVELTWEEAKKLHADLAEMFAKPAPVIVNPILPDLKRWDYDKMPWERPPVIFEAPRRLTTGDKIPDKYQVIC